MNLETQGSYTSIIVSVQVIAEQSFHSVFLAAYYPEVVFDCMGLGTFQSPSVVGQQNQAKASGLFDFEREHSSEVTFSSVVNMPLTPGAKY
jgi:hypothetical protein